MKDDAVFYFEHHILKYTDSTYLQLYTLYTQLLELIVYKYYTESPVSDMSLG